MIRTLCLFVLLLGTVPAFGAAQDAKLDLVPGRRIRIHQQGAKPIEGNLVRFGSDSLTMITLFSDTVTVSRASIVRLELYQGTHAGTGKGAVSGLLIGAVAGAVIGVALSGSDDDAWFEYGAGAWAASGAFTFGLIGTVVGALVGSGKRVARWTPAVLPVIKIQPGNGVDGAGVAVGVRLRL